MSLAQALVSPWGAVPVAALVMILIAGHIVRVEERTTPSSRRRLRMANGWVMLVTAPLIAAGASVFDPWAQQRAFTLTWLMIIALLAVSIAIAFVDIANTLILARRAARRLRRESALAALADVRRRRAQRAERDADAN